MTAKVIISTIQGQTVGKKYVFDSRTTNTIGRHDDCSISLPTDREHSSISRFHCFLDINPPQIRIRDFGSLNGTYVNDRKIGQRPEGVSAEKGQQMSFPEVDLQNGDRIKLGETIFQIGIEKSNQPQAAAVQPPAGNLLEIVKRLFGMAAQKQPAAKAIDGYELGKLLGRGGCGEVYLARHIETGKKVAFKVMLPQVAADERAVQMFVRETENISLLNHPNVVRMYGYGQAEGIFYFTMEYCNGGSVEDIMASYGGKLPPKVAIPIILQVLDGLDYAHNVPVGNLKFPDGRSEVVKGLVHRDLKPGNMFVHTEGDNTIVKVGDYGLSKAFDLAGMSGMSVTGSVAGTLVFMPRQQVLNFKYAKPDVDVWAAAASLYYMLTGDFPREITGDPIAAILTNPVIPIRDRDRSIPRELAHVIDAALQEEPRIYFQSAMEFQQALIEAIS
jgi:eukaryotic-like serine/threonine-protein kinase